MSLGRGRPQKSLGRRACVASEPVQLPGPEPCRARIPQGWASWREIWRRGTGRMSEPQIVVGIDVAKAWLDVAVRPSGEQRRGGEGRVGVAGGGGRWGGGTPRAGVFAATGG